jgi:hypothetical protein
MLNEHTSSKVLGLLLARASIGPRRMPSRSRCTTVCSKPSRIAKPKPILLSGFSWLLPQGDNFTDFMHSSPSGRESSAGRLLRTLWSERAAATAPRSSSLIHPQTAGNRDKETP